MASAAIQAIDHASVHRLTSGQVVIDLQTAVKELLENALDAGATSIQISFREHGVESFEVQDNGRGIDQQDWPGIALKHHTSKLTTFTDLTTVSTLGFRGEALSSLCGTASLSITTSTAATAPIGTCLSFDRNGQCTPGSKTAMKQGTTVLVKELFSTLPVRRKELIKNCKREFGKAVELLQSYAIIKTGVRIVVRNFVKGKWQTQLQTQAAASLRTTFSTLFSAKALANMMDLDLDLAIAPDKSVLKWSDGTASPFAPLYRAHCPASQTLNMSNPSETRIVVKGLVSKPTTGSGKTSGNRQFYYINGRPFSPTKIAKTFNEVYKSFNTGSFPCVVANFQLPTDAYDVNVSPDKRTIFLHSEGHLIAALKTALEETFQPSRSLFSMTHIGSPDKKSKYLKAKGKERQLDSGDEEAEGERQAELTDEDEPGPRPTSARGSSSDDEENDEERKPDVSHIVLDLPTPLSVSLANETPQSHSQLSDVDELAASAPPTSSQPIVVTSPEPGQQPEAPAEVETPPSSSSPLLHSPPPAKRRKLSTSPSSPSPPPRPDPKPIFRQVTLDTTGASWLKPSPSSSVSTAATAPKRKNIVFPSTLQNKLGTLTQFAHPSSAMARKRSFIDDEAEVKGSRGSEEDEEDEEGEEDEDDRRFINDIPSSDVGDGESVAGLSPIKARRLVQEGDGFLEEDPEGSDEDDMIIDEDSFTHPNRRESVDEGCDCPHAATPPTVLELSDSGLDTNDDDNDELLIESTPADLERDAHLASLDASSSSQPGDLNPEISGEPLLALETTLILCMSSLISHWTRSTSATSAQHPPPSTAIAGPLAGASIDKDDARAEETLSRVVSKADFEAMTVVGQFNLGFIIARRKMSDGEEGQDDLFIVDQHASDEKYNFEELQKGTTIASQRLLQPRALNLPSYEEIIAMENVDLLKLNGFEVQIDDDADVGQRVKLVAQPVSKDTVFGTEDFEELLDLIANSSAGEIVRPSKTRKMFASRACRKSVMIGKALSTNQMTSILRHMGGMDQPWLAGLGASAPNSRANVAALLKKA